MLRLPPRSIFFPYTTLSRSPPYFIFFFLLIRHPPSSPLFPYPTLFRSLRAALVRGGRPLPVYVGMRNWHPFLHETLAAMAADGRRRAERVSCKNGCQLRMPT